MTFIKPSSPTPSHLKSYNLSLLDQANANKFMPWVTFYPNTGTSHSSHDKTLDLKKSLSQTLTKYYPFAGRYAKIAPSYVDCNDEGAEFLEESIDSTLSGFIERSQHKDLDQFFPYGLIYFKSNRGDDNLHSDQVIPLAVQVNHFECGGVALAVSLSHKVADGCSLAQFMNDWAKMMQFCCRGQKEEKYPIEPLFLPFKKISKNFMDKIDKPDDVVTRSFVFPNSKINDLKLKVISMTADAGQPIINPTRVEVLNWLLYKCAVAAATINNLGSWTPTSAVIMANLRGRTIDPLPENSIGNFSTVVEIPTNNESELKPETFIGEFKKKKMELKGLRNMETIFGHISKASSVDLEEFHRRSDEAYNFSSMCGFPLYEVDFGWGKPVKATFAGNAKKNMIFLLDTPGGDGIEALVCLGNDDMNIFQDDHEMLAFS